MFISVACTVVLPIIIIITIVGACVVEKKCSELMCCELTCAYPTTHKLKKVRTFFAPFTIFDRLWHFASRVCCRCGEFFLDWCTYRAPTALLFLRAAPTTPSVLRQVPTARVFFCVCVG